MAELVIAFRLPQPGLPRAVFRTDYGLRGGRLEIDGVETMSIGTRAELEAGVEGRAPGDGAPLWIGLSSEPDAELELRIAGERAPREDELSAPLPRSAWVHATIGFAASTFGFIASYLYLVRSEAAGDNWALRMAIHMAAWHAILVLTLFPASIWGKRIGVRAVQLVSAVFFVIHAGIAIANAIDPPRTAEGPGIAVLNALSGIFFLFAVLFGQRVHREMGEALTRSSEFESAAACREASGTPRPH